GLGRRIVFTGFLRGPDVERVFRAADLFVMPSVSEPFGLVPLEALAHGVPAIISRQSGVAEILHSAPKVDFWDTHRLADMILAVLQRPGLHAFLRRQGMIELSHLRWENSARDCLALYDRLVRAASRP
ncbi:MAG: glycosyltransferase family 4 protein, partial [Phycisphaerae bacterium]|nr:glycosyltransferase family 4 protein [Phycisphaerae bacterium]